MPGAAIQTLPKSLAARPWVRQSKIDAACDASPDATLTTAERQELIALSRELRQAKQERDMLAKATAWFAHKSEADTPSTR